MEIILASGNRHKYVEMKEAFAKVGIDLIFGGDFNNPIDVEETGTTFEENALQKATSWAKATGKLAMSDDSGLEVDALNGRPGIYSARIVPGSDQDRVNWLLEEMKNIPDGKRTARFTACIAVVNPETGKNITCTKSCEGKIAQRVSNGTAGFGYDPVFIPEHYEDTFADLGDEIKRKISHRALAIKGLCEKLKLMI